MHPGHLPRGIDSRDDPEAKDASERVKEEPDVEVEIRILEEPAIAQHRQDDDRKDESDDPANEREQDILHEELSHESCGGRAEGLADPDLRRALDDSADVDIHQIDGGEKHEEKRREEESHGEYRALVPPAVRKHLPCGSVELSPGLGFDLFIARRWKFHLLHAGGEFALDPGEVRRIESEDEPDAVEQELLLVLRVGGREIGNPDVGKRDLPVDRDVRDDSHHPETLAVCFE